MIMGFIDELRTEWHAVESVCRVLSGQGCQVAARTYRDWKAAQPSTRAVEEAYLMNEIWDLFHVRDERTGAWRASAESLYGRRKVTAWLGANGRPDAAYCIVARCLNAMGTRGFVAAGRSVRRSRRGMASVPGTC
jgi:hypothetical protein